MATVFETRNPPASLLAKRGSILVHVEEAESAGGHAFDWVAVKSLLADPEVRTWLATMDELGFLPRRRDAPAKPTAQHRSKPA